MAIERRSTQMSTIEEIQAQIDEAQPGTVIHVPAGKVRGRLTIDKSLTLRGAGADRTVIDGRGRGAVISIDAEDAEVRIEEMTISNGKSSHGGGISIDNGAQVFVVGCLLEKNAAKSGRGGAIAVDYGAVYITECTLVQNRAMIGGAVFVGGQAKAEISASILADNTAIKGGGIAVADGAELDVFTSRLQMNQAEVEGHHIFAYGTRTRRPRLVLSNALLDAADAAGLAISSHGHFKADIVIDNSTLGRDRLPTILVG